MKCWCSAGAECWLLIAGVDYLMQFVLQRLLAFSRPLLIGREYSPARALSGLVCCMVLLSFSSIVSPANMQILATRKNAQDVCAANICVFHQN